MKENKLALENKSETNGNNFSFFSKKGMEPKTLTDFLFSRAIGSIEMGWLFAGARI